MPEWVNQASRAFAESAAGFILIFAFPVLISFLIYLAERWVTSWMIRTGGVKLVWVTAWLGTPVHESAHALMCFIFRCPVKEIRFFIPDPESSVLGYVRYSYQKWNPFHWIGRWMIGLAPLVAGASVLAAILFFTGAFGSDFPVFPVSQTETESLKEIALRHFSLIHSIWHQIGRQVFSPGFFSSPLNWVWLYTASAIAMHMAPSVADLKGTVSGWILLFILYSGYVLAGAAVGLPEVNTGWLLSVSLYVTGIMTAALFFSGLNLGFWFFLLNLLHRLKTGYWLFSRNH